MMGHPPFKTSGSALIKVLLVTGSYPPMRCGVGDYTAGLARALRDSGKARVAVLIGEDGEEDAGIEMIRIRGWSLRNALGALRAVVKWKPDVVHLQFPTQGYRSHWLPWILPLLLRPAGGRSLSPANSRQMQKRAMGRESFGHGFPARRGDRERIVRIRRGGPAFHRRGR